jgi:hypothetical protein
MDVGFPADPALSSGPCGRPSLGTTGLRVSELCLGTMTFGTGWGWGADEPTCRAILDPFDERGGSFTDTADAERSSRRRRRGR